MKKNLFIKIANQFLKLLFFPILLFSGLFWAIKRILKRRDFLISELYEHLDITFFITKLTFVMAFHIATLCIFIKDEK